VALGVPLETALRDYALTNQYLPLDQQTIARASKLVPPTFDPQSLHVLMAADPQYARAAFESIDEKFGSFKNYRRTALDLSDSSLAELKTNLLQARCKSRRRIDLSGRRARRKEQLNGRLDQSYLRHVRCSSRPLPKNLTLGRPNPAVH
jgi:hypothetical protein